jgi:hypothetical protein
MALVCKRQCTNMIKQCYWVGIDKATYDHLTICLRVLKHFTSLEIVLEICTRGTIFNPLQVQVVEGTMGTR